jgi:hypothetical protein
MRDELWQSLQDAATRSGWTLSEEMVMRLERARQAEAFGEQFLDLAYGRQHAALVQLAAAAMNGAGSFATMVVAAGRGEGLPRDAWFDDPLAYTLATQVLRAVLSALRPAGPPDTDYSEAVWSISTGILRDIARKADTGPLAGIGERLGPQAVQRVKEFLERSTKGGGANG